jgi:hypothetical protein
MCTIGQVPAKSHRIKLSKSERHELEAFRDQKSGKASGIMRAVALLLSDEGPHGPAMKDADIQAQSGRRCDRRLGARRSLHGLRRDAAATPGQAVSTPGGLPRFILAVRQKVLVAVSFGMLARFQWKNDHWARLKSDAMRSAA